MESKRNILFWLAGAAAGVGGVAAWLFSSGDKKSDAPPPSSPTGPIPKVEPSALPMFHDDEVAIAVNASHPTRAGQPVEVKLRLSDLKTGKPITDEQLAAHETMKMHLFLVDQSLQDYHHIHPMPTGNPGEMGFSFTPKTDNRYGGWALEVTRKDHVTHRIKIGLPAAKEQNISPNIAFNDEVEANGLKFRWHNAEPLRQGRDNVVEVTVEDAKTREPITDLAPLMGYHAQITGFSADGSSLIHTEPLGEEITDNRPGGPTLKFVVKPEQKGPMQFYIQVNRNGEDVYAPFGQNVLEPERQQDKLRESRENAEPQRG